MPGRHRAIGQVTGSQAAGSDGVAVRVPVEDGSLTDLTALVRQEVTADQINNAFRMAADGPLAAVLRYTTDPLVSRDAVGDPASCIFDAPLTQAAGRVVNVFGWYDTRDLGSVNASIEDVLHGRAKARIVPLP